MGSRSADHEVFVPGQMTEGARQQENRILAALRTGPATLRQLERATGLSSAVLTAHLPQMANHGLVRWESLYSLPPKEG